MSDLKIALSDAVVATTSAVDAKAKISFITWYPSCRRSDALAIALGGPSHLIHYFEFKKPLHAPVKYLLQTVATWRRLWADRPAVVLVASPPVIAVLAVWLYCKVTGSDYVIDAHTGVFDDPRWAWAQPLGRWLSRGALSTVVTNDHLAGIVAGWGASGQVIGTVPVQFPAASPADLGDGQHVAVINTFSQDEPIAALLDAARALPDVTFHITGNLKHARQSTDVTQTADNIRFTGWLSDQQYSALLRGVDAVVCLTTSDHTMQRGAYEAMALGQPLITSHWQILRDTFSLGTEHVDNSPQQIAAGIRVVLENRPAMHQAMCELRAIRDAQFAQRIEQLKAVWQSPRDSH